MNTVENMTPEEWILFYGDGTGIPFGKIGAGQYADFFQTSPKVSSNGKGFVARAKHAKRKRNKVEDDSP